MLARILLVGAGSAILAQKLAETLAQEGVEAVISSSDTPSKSPEQQLDEVIAVATSPGNAYADPYLLGMANGLILAKSTLTGKEPEYMRMEDKPEAQDQSQAGVAPDPFGPEPADVLSRDARFDVLDAAQSMLTDVENDEVVAVSLVGITSEGSVRLYASESTGQTLNMLAQGIKVADGTLTPDEV